MIGKASLPRLEGGVVYAMVKCLYSRESIPTCLKFIQQMPVHPLHLRLWEPEAQGRKYVSREKRPEFLLVENVDRGKVLGAGC